MEAVDSSVIRAENILEQSGYTPEKVMLEVGVPCTELISRCSWIGKEIECNKIFRKVKSSNGFCCSFNYHALKDEYDMYVFFYIHKKRSKIEKFLSVFMKTAKTP